MTSKCFAFFSYCFELEEAPPCGRGYSLSDISKIGSAKGKGKAWKACFYRSHKTRILEMIEGRSAPRIMKKPHATDCGRQKTRILEKKWFVR
jgi:hypothetical protein